MSDQGGRPRSYPPLGDSVRYPAEVSFDTDGQPDKAPLSDSRRSIAEWEREHTTSESDGSDAGEQLRERMHVAARGDRS